MHHPNFDRIDETLMDAWRVRIPGEEGGCITDSEKDARTMADEDPEAPLEVVPMRIHREIYEALGEFAGF